jgi:predicted Zn-dependent peptidase
MYKKTELKNGLRVVTHEMKDRDSISIGFWVGAGGRYETDDIKGVAHFLEHLLFKGSKKYSCNDIKEKVEGVGGALNAFTSEEQTCYYAKIPAKHINQTFDVLADMVFFPTIKQKDVTSEKTVIIEEIKMYHDLPQYYVLDALEGLMWPNHPLGKGLAGTIETVSGLESKHLRDFHQKHYVPQNIVLSVCGNVKHKKIVDLVCKKLQTVKGIFDPSYEKSRLKQKKPQVAFCQRPIEQMHVALGFPGYDENHKDRYALSLLSVLLGGNMSSRLFVEIREKRGLAYSISSSSKTLHDTGMFVVRAGVDNKKLVGAIELVLKELKKVAKTKVSLSEFERARDYLLGQLLLGLEDTMDQMLWIGESVVSKNRTRTLKNIIKDFKKITPDDLLRVAKDVFKPSKANLAIVGPISAHQKRKINKLLA